MSIRTENLVKENNNIISQIKNISKVLATSGICFTDYIAQLTYLLFLKMDEEKEKFGMESHLPSECQWKDLYLLEGKEILVKYESILKHLAECDGIVGAIFTNASNKINSPVNLRKIIDIINKNNWFIPDSDITGAIYEKILDENGRDTKSGAGQYFTPKPLITAIIDVINPKITETVSDPCCGTGGFLISAYKHMKKQSKNEKDLLFLKTQALKGADNTAQLVSLASMNLYLNNIGINESPIILQDSLLDNSCKMMSDVIITNPPYGSRPLGCDDISLYRKFFIKTSDNQINFIQHIMSIIKKNGRVAIVVTDSILSDGDSKKIRDKLLNSYNLHTILRLPSGIFYANNIKTNVLFFNEGTPTKDIWVYDYRTGIKHTLVQKPLERANLQEFVDCYCSGHFCDRTESYNAETNPNGRWRRFSENEVKSRNDLNFKWIDLSEDDDRSIDEILEEMKEEALNITRAVEQLKVLLGGINL